MEKHEEVFYDTPRRLNFFLKRNVHRNRDRAWFSACCPPCVWSVSPGLRRPRLAVCALGCLMSRGDELRQLAAQLSVLAALEDSIAVAFPGSWAPPVLVVLPSLPMLARLWLPLFRRRPQCPRRCLRPAMRWRPLCCAPRLSGLPLLGLALAPAPLRRCLSVLHVHRVAVPALPLACVVQSLWRSRDWLRAWPPRVAHRSRLPSCGSHASLVLFTLPQSGRSLPPTLLDPLHPLLQPPRLLVPRSLRPTPMTNGTHSLTHMASPHLLVAPRPPSPSRLTPLELVGVLATSVAAVSAKPPSAPCGGTFELLLLPLRVLPFGVASLVGSLWARACFRGSCRIVGPCGLLLRLLGLRALSGVAGAGSGVAISSVSLKTWRSPTCVTLLPGYVFARQGSSWWSPSLAKRLHRCRICCSWTSLSCSWVWRLQVVS